MNLLLDIKLGLIYLESFGAVYLIMQLDSKVRMDPRNKAKLGVAQQNPSKTHINDCIHGMSVLGNKWFLRFFLCGFSVIFPLPNWW